MKERIENNGHNQVTTIMQTTADYFPSPTPKQYISKQLDRIAIDSMDQLPDAIEACKALIKVINNGHELSVNKRFLDACSNIVGKLNEMDDTKDEYYDFLRQILKEVTDRFHWFTLFQGRELQRLQLTLVNDPLLYPAYQKQLFTIDQILQLDFKQYTCLMDSDVMQAIEREMLTFDQAMQLDCFARMKLAEQFQNTNASLIK